MIWLTAPAAHWNLWSLAVITVFTMVSDLTAVEAAHPASRSPGRRLGLMLAVVLLGAAPAAVIGIITIVVSWSCRSNRGRAPPA